MEQATDPLAAHALAIRASAPGSVTRAAPLSMTTSASRIDTAIEHRDRARHCVGTATAPAGKPTHSSPLASGTRPAGT